MNYSNNYPAAWRDIYENAFWAIEERRRERFYAERNCYAMREHCGNRARQHEEYLRLRAFGIIALAAHKHRETEAEQRRAIRAGAR